MTKELLDKYLNNSCTSQEVEEVIHWMKQQSFFNESKRLGSIDWQQFEEKESIVSDEKLENLLDKIHHKLNIEEPRTIQIKRNKIIGWIFKAAVILLIPVLTILIYTISENNRLKNQITSVSVDSLEVIAPVGSRTVFELSDGSVVYLNYGSRIKYPQNFWGETRGVDLTGEAYFEVAHNPDKPFVVHAGRIDVKAVGTVFNVNAYPENNDIATTLVEGKVLLEKQLAGSKTEQLGAMKPGQHVIYNSKTGQLISDVGDVNKYIAWKDGKMVFDNTPITTVARELSRKFNVDIEVANGIKDLTFTVTFVDDPLYLILDLMTETTPVKYHRLPRKKLADGTYSKQIIKIEKRN